MTTKHGARRAGSTTKLDPHKRPIIAVFADWGSVSSAFEENGAYVVKVETDERAKRVLPYVDAIALTGGGDVDPERYGAKPHKQVYGISTSRDDREFAAVAYAQEYGLPMFGICRGLQLLNVAHGGSLDQHIGDNSEAFSHEGTQHFIKLRRASRFAQATGLYGLSGTHLHHQRIERIGDGLLPTGWAHDGTIEFIESAPNYDNIVVATQFHPEMDYAYDDDAGEIFKHFVALVSERIRPDVAGRWKKLKKITSPLASVVKYGNPTGPRGVWTKRTDGSWVWESPTGSTVMRTNPSATGSSDTTTTGTEDDYRNWWDKQLSDDRYDWDEDDEEYEEWMRLNGGAYSKFGDAFDFTEQEECDNRCSFPPCRDVVGCSAYNDCAAETIAIKEAQAASARLNDANQTTLVTMTVDEYERIQAIEAGKRGSRR